MNRILILLAMLVAGNVYALPPCPPDVFHNCFGTKEDTNGNKYVGEFKDNHFHGEGTFTFAHGDKYVGEWKEGKFHGEGTATFANGDKYVGEVKDSRPNGRGTQTYANGDKYLGEWKDGKKHGQGTYSWPEGGQRVKYVGWFKNDKSHGQGKLTLADGRQFVGEYRSGKVWVGIVYDMHGEVIGFYSKGIHTAGTYKDASLSLSGQWKVHHHITTKDERSLVPYSLIIDLKQDRTKVISTEVWEQPWEALNSSNSKCGNNHPMTVNGIVMGNSFRGTVRSEILEAHFRLTGDHDSLHGTYVARWLSGPCAGEMAGTVTAQRLVREDGPDGDKK
jgi:hypothetical protein